MPDKYHDHAGYQLSRLWFCRDNTEYTIDPGSAPTDYISGPGVRPPSPDLPQDAENFADTEVSPWIAIPGVLSMSLAPVKGAAVDIVRPGAGTSVGTMVLVDRQYAGPISTQLVCAINSYDEFVTELVWLLTAGDLHAGTSPEGSAQPYRTFIPLAGTANGLSGWWSYVRHNHQQQRVEAACVYGRGQINAAVQTGANITQPNLTIDVFQNALEKGALYKAQTVDGI